MIAESALHAYADGEVDEAMRLEVETWLHDNTSDLVRIEDWRAQRKCLGALYDGVLSEPIQKEMLKELRGFPGASGGFLKYSRMILAAVFLLIGGSVGWFLAVNTGTTGAPSAGGFSVFSQSKYGFERFVLDAHRLYAGDKRRYVEISSKKGPALSRWLSGKLGRKVTPPDLTGQGFALRGGRLLPSDGQAVGAYMYENARRKRLTLFVTAVSPQVSTDKSVGGSSLRAEIWGEDGFQFAVVGAFNQDKLSAVKKRAKDHF